jgi:protein-L-isoaspartate(D-aspartate) O-methyltransferase
MSGRWSVPNVTIVLAGIAMAAFVFFSMAHWGPWRAKPPASDPSSSSGEPSEAVSVAASSEPLSESPELIRGRNLMVERHLRARGIDNQRVLDVMGRIRRQEFVPAEYRDSAYADRPLPIGHNQTISQPYIVALMTQLVKPKPNGRVLDIGTGSGYQAAILAELSKEVYSIEIVESLAEDARDRLNRLGYKNVTVRHGDGYRGWPEVAPFDAIIVAAAPDHVPQPLIDQLAPGGRLVIPVGRFSQELLLVEKQPDGSVQRRVVAGVAFVPMTGEAEGVR